MSYAQRLILYSAKWNSPELERFVKACIADKVVLICVWGDDCSRVEDVIDELVVGDGSDPRRFVNTTSHPGATLDDVRLFASNWTLNVDPKGRVQEIRLVAP